ncbi:MAG: helix-turn-helix transcriptional regulator [Desulfobacterium sp.]|nr:helix-turn-helix transcriptional regulator [Desulfobacterium sp.]
MKITQQYIADQAGVSVQFVNQVVSRKTLPSWKRAKQFAQITGTKPELWLDGTEEEIRATLSGKQKRKKVA